MVYVRDVVCSDCHLTFGWRLHLHLLPRPAEVRGARRAVHASLSSWGCLPPVVDDCVLLTSELVGNAVMHGADAPITVNLLQLGDRLLLEVTDASPAVARVQSAGPEDEQGRGMYLVQAIASAWGTRLDSSGGKTVWCTVTLHPGGSPEPVGWPDDAVQPAVADTGDRRRSRERHDRQ